LIHLIVFLPVGILGEGAHIQFDGREWVEDYANIMQLL